MAEQKEEKKKEMKTIEDQIKEVFGKIETIEKVKGELDRSKWSETRYPKSLKRHFLVLESFGMSLEEHYYWVMDNLVDFGFVDIDKIVDTFTASEQSTFFGSAQQRLGLQQDKAANYMALIGKMVKELFQIVREIRLLDERERLYKLALEKKDDGAEKALKGLWIDFIDNGPQGIKASSVYGMASQLGFNVLPDIFFATPAALKQEDITAYVNKLDYNDKVKSALLRKLEQYVAWRDATAKEIASKKRFTIQYLKQHYNAIKLYVDWVKPYLRNVRRLMMNPEAQLSADLVGAFEGSILEVEFLAKKPGKKDEPRSCILATFFYKTRPIMQTGQEFHRGPVHVGRMEMTLRAYAWTDEEIKEYKRIKMLEDFEFLKSIDESVKESMDQLGDELRTYLEEEHGVRFGDKERLAKMLLETKAASTLEDAREKAKKMIEKEKANKGPSPFEPVTSIFSGLAEIGKSFVPGKNSLKEAKKKEEDLKEGRDKASGVSVRMLDVLYKIFKKSRRLLVS